MSKKNRPKRRTNRSRPVNAQEVANIRDHAGVEAMDCTWAVFFSVMYDKHGFNRDQLTHLHVRICDVSQEYVDGSMSTLTLFKKAWECTGVPFGFDKYDPPKKMAAAEMAKVREWSIKAAENVSWSLYFIALSRTGYINKRQMREVWKQVQYLMDSIQQGYVSVQDLYDTLRDEVMVNISRQ